jgi:hypothetical protein
VKVPSPSYGEYLKFVATVLSTIAVLQYVGIFGRPAELDIAYLAVLGLILPIFTYLLTVVLANVDSLSQWERMTRPR